MAGTRLADGNRRNPLPLPFVAEYVRPPLVERLQHRFTSPVTTVVAGAGFGKSTALAQAVRHNALAPLGIDAWVGCRPGHENATELAGAMLDALDPAPRVVPTLDGVLSTIVAASPLDVCLIIDDCHLVAARSTGEEFLVQLVRNLPGNGHLVLSGRRLPDVPLARLKAAGGCTTLASSDLAFSSADVAAVAELLDRDPQPASELGGWPALVRLALVARPGADRQFLREEVLGELPAELVRALVALVAVGPATADVVARVIDGAGDLAELCERLPLIARTADGRYSAHQLWEDAALASVTAAELAAVHRRAHGVLLDAGELSAAGAVAIASGDWQALGRTAVRLVSRAPTALPTDTVRQWRAATPAGVDVPGLRLLDAAARYMGDTRDPGVQPLVDDVLSAARLAGDVPLEAVGITVAAIVAHSHGDLRRLLPLAVRATELAGQVDDPTHRLLVGSLPAVAADLAGDPEGVLTALSGIPWDELPAGVGRTAQHLRLQALWLAGKAADSVPIADEVFGGEPGTYIAGVPWLCRWLAGDPTGAPPWEDERAPAISSRDMFVAGCLMTVVHACRGDSARLEHIWNVAPLASMGFDNARDSAHLTYARAARAVAEHDDAEAGRHYAAHLAVYPVADALGERHLRRWPALGYVLSAELRRHWDRVDLGPAHAMARDCARALLAARAGRVVDAPTAAEMFTQLPLPWSVELASRWHDLGSRRGAELATYLVDAAGQAALVELRRAGEQFPGAAALLRLLPLEPSTRLELRVLGPLQLLRDGAPVDDPALRRLRVRQLLTLLAVERTVRRDRVLDLLWPDLPPEKASTNLRVTLAHLRRCLEPERASGGAGFHLRTDATTLTLHESAHLVVDLWELEAAHARLDLPSAAPHRQQRLLAEAAALHRGEPLADLAGVEGMDAVTEHLRRRYAADLLRLGELQIAAGQAAAALDCSQRVLAGDPYREQAHRLAIAALHQLDDDAGVAAALKRLDAALADLGVPPEAATEILRRQAGRPRHAHQSAGTLTTSR